MKAEPFLEPLVLKQKPKLFVQLAASIVLVLMAMSAYFSLPDIVDGTKPAVDSSINAPPLWFIITVSVLAFIPAVFLFNLINSNMQLAVEN